MNLPSRVVEECVSQSSGREQFWTRFLQVNNSKSVAEIGVYKGDFSATLLQHCEAIEDYYMVDPWAYLNDWNKPANASDEAFEAFFVEMKRKTAFAAHKRIILRGKTTEVIDKIPDNSLDFAYIDGDHTLKGITIDLVSIFPKVKVGGWMGGDDFSNTVWQHHTSYEPSLVFPLSVYFAEAVGVPIYGLPDNQFLIEKTEERNYAFFDLAGLYTDVELRDQFGARRVLALKFEETFPRTTRMLKMIKRIFG